MRNAFFRKGFYLPIFEKENRVRKKYLFEENCAIITQLWTRNKKSGVEQ